MDIFENIQQKRNESLRELLENSPELTDSVNEQSVTPLVFAGYCGNLEAVKIIREFKEELNIFEACITGDHETVSQYIESENGDVDTISPDGFSILGLSVFFGQEELARYLVKKGANVNLPSENSMKVAPLHSAVARGDYDLTRFLLESGADPNIPQQKGILPLHSAAHQGRKDITGLLLLSGANISLKSEDGNGASDYARDSENKELINFLIEKENE